MKNEEIFCQLSVLAALSSWRMITLLIATRNTHKVQEIRSILGDRFQYRTLKDFPNAPKVVENAATFAGNATKKAVELARWLGRSAVHPPPPRLRRVGSPRSSSPRSPLWKRAHLGSTTRAVGIIDQTQGLQSNPEGCQKVAGGHCVAATPGHERRASCTPERGARNVLRPRRPAYEIFR